ncbi:MAG: hypothetical protein K2X81_22705 [Candidatus Obscuribacterales bacterium]|nr:hypothetical protein [Candidatus Obscuribacterales bacterium]
MTTGGKFLKTGTPTINTGKAIAGATMKTIRASTNGVKKGMRSTGSEQ